MNPTRLLIGDSQKLMADAVAQALDRYPDIHVIDSRPVTGQEVLVQAAAHKPDAILIDYWLDILGPALTKIILARRPTTKVMLLSWFHGSKEMAQALAAGAVAFLPKSLTVREVAEAVVRAVGGENPVHAKEIGALISKIEARDRGALVAWERIGTLTDREIMIVRLLSLGYNVDEIGKKLFISIKTTRKHVDNTIRKLGVNSQLEVVSIARQSGLVQ